MLLPSELSLIFPQDLFPALFVLNRMSLRVRDFVPHLAMTFDS